jgi:GAF domain-containing protein
MPDGLRHRAQNPRAATAAFGELARTLAADPHRVLASGVEICRRLYDAGSAGISVLRPSRYGHADFEWQAVSGAMAKHRGAGTPGDFSPCGLCLDTGTAIVLVRPERAFTYLAGVRPPIFETLVVPLYDDDGTPLGALWVAHHDPDACFGADDVLILERLALPMALALKRAQAGCNP